MKQVISITLINKKRNLYIFTMLSIQTFMKMNYCGKRSRSYWVMFHSIIYSFLYVNSLCCPFAMVEHWNDVAWVHFAFNYLIINKIASMILTVKCVSDIMKTFSLISKAKTLLQTSPVMEITENLDRIIQLMLSGSWNAKKS